VVITRSSRNGASVGLSSRPCTHAPVHIPFNRRVLNNASQSHASEFADQFIGVTLISTPVNLDWPDPETMPRHRPRGLFILLHDDAEVKAGWMEALGRRGSIRRCRGNRRQGAEPRWHVAKCRDDPVE
jgi:hypothetical protein